MSPSFTHFNEMGTRLRLQFRARSQAGHVKYLPSRPWHFERELKLVRSWSGLEVFRWPESQQADPGTSFA